MDAMTTPAEQQAAAPRFTRGVTWLIAMLLGVQFVQYTLLQPSDVQGALGFRRGDLDGGHWWSIATYSLAHASLWLTLLNAYALAYSGPRLERLWGSRRFLAFVAFAAIGGWMLHLFIGGDAMLLGATAMALGTLTAYAMQWGGEDHTLAGGFIMSGRWVSILIGALVLLVGLQESSATGGGPAFVSHLGGLVVAWTFVRATKVTLVEQFRDGVQAVPDEPPEDQPPRAVPKTLPRSRARERETIDDVVARSNAQSARRTQAVTKERPPVEAVHADGELTLDMVLDKISAHGIEHLTPEERHYLETHSRRLRER